MYNNGIFTYFTVVSQSNDLLIEYAQMVANCHRANDAAEKMKEALSPRLVSNPQKSLYLDATSRYGSISKLKAVQASIAILFQ
jgi:hypothetical protein